MLRPLVLLGASCAEFSNFFPRVKDGGLAVKEYLPPEEGGEVAQSLQKKIDIAYFFRL